MAVVFTIAFTFIHEYFPLKPEEQIEHKRVYKEIIKNRDDNFEALLTQLKNDEISKDQYIIDYIKIKKKSQSDGVKYKEDKKKLAKKYSYLGYTSIKFYLLGISLPVFGLLTSTLLLFLVVKEVNYKYEGVNKFKQKFYITVCLTIMATWFYWICWSNLYLTQDPSRTSSIDFTRETYNGILYALPIVFTIIMYYLFKYFKTIEEKFRTIIGMFYNSLYSDLPDNEFIRPEKDKEYQIYRSRLTEKAIKNE